MGSSPRETIVMRPVLLVVDDEITIRDTLANLLTKEGYAVETAADGLDALEKLHGGLSPALIVLDLTMPRLDGLAFQKAASRRSGVGEHPRRRDFWESPPARRHGRATLRRVLV